MEKIRNRAFSPRIKKLNKNKMDDSCYAHPLFRVAVLISSIATALSQKAVRSRVKEPLRCIRSFCDRPYPTGVLLSSLSLFFPLSFLILSSSFVLSLLPGNFPSFLMFFDFSVFSDSLSLLPVL